MFEEGFYYGRCRLLITASGKQNEGCPIIVTNSDKSREFEGVIVDGRCEIYVPGRDEYTVSIYDADKEAVRKSTTVICGYGEFKKVEVGVYTEGSIEIKGVVNEGKPEDYYSAGDQVIFKENGVNVKYDILHVNYKKEEFGANVILGRHDALPVAKYMNKRGVNTGGFGASEVCKYLNNEFITTLPDDLQASISTFKFSAGVGNGQNAVREEEHKIWLPVEYNVFGEIKYSVAAEHSGAVLPLQFSYFSAANRGQFVKCLGDSGAITDWWLASPFSTNGFCYVTKSGGAHRVDARYERGVVPCFMIAADGE